ncbi:MAG: hypothetical protein Q9218_002702 [Villophora microphyllina]
MSQADEHLPPPASEGYGVERSHECSSSNRSYNSATSYPSSSRGATPDPHPTSTDQYDSPPTSDCASMASEPPLLPSEHRSIKVSTEERAETFGMAGSQVDTGCDSECEEEHEGGVLLSGHQDDLNLNQQLGQLIEIPETPQLSPSPLEDLQQHITASSWPNDGDVGSVSENEDNPFAHLNFMSPTEDLMDIFADHLPYGAHPSLDGDDADMDSDAEEQLVAALGGPFSLAPIPTEPNNAAWDSFPTFEQAESVFDEPYPQLFPWYASSALQAYHYEIGFFGPQDERKNMSFLEFLRFWRDGYALQQQDPNHTLHDRKHFTRLTNREIHRGMRARRRSNVSASDLEKYKCDIQGIDWNMMDVERRQARIVRRNTYFNHANVITSYKQAQVFNQWPMFSSATFVNRQGRDKVRGRTSIQTSENYFRFSRMSLRHQISIPHFQLRHIVSASSKNAVFFPSVTQDEDGMQTTASQITCVNPEVENDEITIDSANTGPNSETPSMQKIYTLTACNGVLVAGGLGGEYAFKSLDSPPNEPFTSGMITHSPLSSTNHVHTYLDRRSGLPRAVFSSNDSYVHTLDCTTNTFTSHHDHIKLVNCAATSPDTRLRVLVRDAKHSLLVEADTGKRIGKLTGHNDFGFACDWADDGVHIATGAQDGVVQIYDVRKWREPMQTLLTELGGVRTLAFSPAAGGKQVLVMAESADFVHIVDGTTFDKKQTFDFFGEIAGVSFEPEGRRFFVGIGDPEVGGLMEFERSPGFNGRWDSTDSDRDVYDRETLLRRATWGPRLKAWE